MRAWEREPKESAKAFSAFKTYRDLGPERSLVKACEGYYGSIRNLAQIKVWSRKFDWVERAAAYDAWIEMIRCETIEAHHRTRAAEFAEQQERLRWKLLENAEIAADQERRMLEWPLAEQHLVRPAGNGEMATYIVIPTKWTKNTIARLHQIASKAAGEPDRLVVEERDYDKYADNPAAQAAIDAFLDAVSGDESADE